MVSVFTQPDINMQEVGRTRDKCFTSWFPAYQAYENCVYIPSCKMVLWPTRACVLFELFYKITWLPTIWCSPFTFKLNYSLF